MTPLEWTVLAGLGVVTGLLVGCVGIGGVMLVPALTVGFGIDIKTAIAAALFSYLFSGGAGLWLFARRGSVPWRPAAWLVAGAVPGALLGARSVALLPAEALAFLVAALMVAAGLNGLRSGHTAARQPVRLAGPVLCAVGLVVGFGSALTGTGGPVMLVPPLLALRWPALATIGLSQAIQLPIAAVASAANTPLLDYGIAGTLAATLAAGALLGARIAYAVPAPALRRVVAAGLVLFGAAMAARLAF